MLCSHGLQASLGPFMHLHWPVPSLWPEVQPLLYQRHLLRTDRQELEDKVQHKILQETQPVPASVTVQPEGQAGPFVLSLDTEGFSPEELCVQQLGRRLTVSGKSERKQEEGKGSSSYTLHQFRREFDLPRRVNPEGVSCYLAADGTLHIQAAEAAEEAERELPIKRIQEEKTQQSVCSHTDGSSTQDTEDKTH